MWDNLAVIIVLVVCSNINDACRNNSGGAIVVAVVGVLKLLHLSCRLLRAVPVVIVVVVMVVAVNLVVADSQYNRLPFLVLTV